MGCFFALQKKAIVFLSFPQIILLNIVPFLKRGLNKCLLSHMPESKTAKKWSHESNFGGAKKYKFRSEFSKKSSGAYDYAVSNGILNKICSHMRPRNSDYDCAYMWTAAKSNGFRLLKVGITSKRLGSTRINKVASESGFKPSDVIIYNCGDIALTIEKELKKVGQSANVGVFNGCTEFIIVSDQEYIKCKELLCNKNQKNGLKQESTE